MFNQLEKLGKKRRPPVAEGLKSRMICVAGISDVFVLPDIGVMSRIPSTVTCNAFTSLDIGVMSRIRSVVTCGFSIWTVAGSLAASHLHQVALSHMWG